jgi:hypothetical protein
MQLLTPRISTELTLTFERKSSSVLLLPIHYFYLFTSFIEFKNIFECLSLMYPRFNVKYFNMLYECLNVSLMFNSYHNYPSIKWFPTSNLKLL